MTSYEEITQDGDTWTISIQASVKHGSVSFKLGEEVDETTPDGRKVRVSQHVYSACGCQMEESSMCIAQYSRMIILYAYSDSEIINIARIVAYNA